jgi:hypothetical protein
MIFKALKLPTLRLPDYENTCRLLMMAERAKGTFGSYALQALMSLALVSIVIEVANVRNWLCLLSNVVSCLCMQIFTG